MRIKELRIKKKLNQNELGKLVGHSGQTILNWENGIHDPSIKELIFLANYFDVSVDYLIGRKSIDKQVNEVCNELGKIDPEEFITFIRESLDKMDKKKRK